MHRGAFAAAPAFQLREAPDAWPLELCALPGSKEMPWSSSLACTTQPPNQLRRLQAHLLPAPGEASQWDVQKLKIYVYTSHSCLKSLKGSSLPRKQLKCFNLSCKTPQDLGPASFSTFVLPIPSLLLELCLPATGGCWRFLAHSTEFLAFVTLHLFFLLHHPSFSH